jgi:hypothetical protein
MTRPRCAGEGFIAMARSAAGGNSADILLMIHGDAAVLSGSHADNA